MNADGDEFFGTTLDAEWCADHEAEIEYVREVIAQHGEVWALRALDNLAVATGVDFIDDNGTANDLEDRMLAAKHREERDLYVNREIVTTKPGSGGGRRPRRVVTLSSAVVVSRTRGSTDGARSVLS